MPLKIALTGATGFVGKVLLSKLLAAGYEVRALARRSQALSPHKNLHVGVGDLADAGALQVLVKDADVVLHLAGVVSAVSRRDFFNTNLEGTRRLAQASVGAGVKRFIYVSSLAARNPKLNAYAASKAAAENMLAGFSPKLETTIVRPAAIYGPGDFATLPLLQVLMSRVAVIPGRRDARFGMAHVDDVAMGLLALVAGSQSGCFALDDQSGGHDWSELVAVTRQHFGLPLKHYFLPKAVMLPLGYLGDLWGRLRGVPSVINSGQIKQIYQPDWRVDGEVLNLTSPTPLQKGLPQTIAWYQAQGLLPHGLAHLTTPADSESTD